MKQKHTFTKTMMRTLILGLGAGILVIILREQLLKHELGSLWNMINNVFFADITATGNERAIGIFYIIGQIFLRSLQLLLIPLIFTSIIRAIQHIKDTQSLHTLAKKGFKNFSMLLGIALAVGLIFGLTSYHLGLFNLPIVDQIEIVQGTAAAGNPLSLILNAFQNNFVSTLGNNGNILAIVVLAFVFGVILQAFPQETETISRLNEEAYFMTTKCLNFLILKLSPLGIFSLLIRTFAVYGVQYVQPALAYMLITTIALLVTTFVIYPLIVYAKTGMKPADFIKKTYKVFAFGFSTSSSAATLPLAQSTVIEDLGVDPNVASFIVPLASTINMTGTAIMQIIATLFIASVAGYHVGLIEIITIVGLTIIGSISTPAAPGAGAILLFTIISGMGYANPAALAAYSFIIAINRPVEMLVTAVNVIDDTVSALTIDHELKEAHALEEVLS